jgi:hypothetical protein
MKAERPAVGSGGDFDESVKIDNRSAGSQFAQVA